MQDISWMMSIVRRSVSVFKKVSHPIYDRQDIWQEAFLKLLTLLGSHPDAPEGLFVISIRNHIRSLLRRKDPKPARISTIYDDERTRDLIIDLKNQEPTVRAAAILYMEGCTDKEVREIIGIGRRTLIRIKHKLRMVG